MYEYVIHTSLRVRGISLLTGAVLYSVVHCKQHSFKILIVVLKIINIIISF